MAFDKEIDPNKQYMIRIGRPIKIDDDNYLLPSHAEIRVSGSMLLEIKDQVLDAHECV